MKKLFLITLSLALAGSGFAQTKKFITLRVDIANRKGDVIYIQKGHNLFRTIHLNPEGFFKDTLTVKEGKEQFMYSVYDGYEGFTGMYLKNGYDLKLTMDAKNYDDSKVFEGVGATENNYMVKSNVLWLDERFPKINKLMKGDEAPFKKALEEIVAADLKRLNAGKLDPNFVAHETKSIKEIPLEFQNRYDENMARKKLNNNVPPTFNFDNYKGGTAKLEDYRGKYVYIDVWATWCGPCRAAIPHLKKLEEKYHDKNITFVSISIDEPKNAEKWRKMVQEKEMGGEQLIASPETYTAMDNFFILPTVPRFILLDPNGKIINSDAPTPSNPEMASLLDSLLK